MRSGLRRYRDAPSIPLNRVCYEKQEFPSDHVKMGFVGEYLGAISCSIHCLLTSRGACSIGALPMNSSSSTV